ncbi:MAG TPA: penicillin-binding protein 1C [Chitinophagaceae bacterium]|nr:penicillin-binding protein 1C [Chitinophagaceae bacterium]
MTITENRYFQRPSFSYIKNKLYKGTKRLAMIIVGLVVIFLLLNLFFPLPGKIEYSTIVTDNKGEVIHAFLTKNEKWRMKAELAEISPLLKKTIVAKEDRYFYYHPGVNPVAVARALVKNILRMKRTSGASTITMQVAKLLEPKKRSYGSKLIEVFRAFQLEWKYSKDEILQLYFNLVPYGGNIEGVKAASLLYFKKSPDHLSLAEITALSIIPNRPSTLIIGRNNDLIIKERNRWLAYFAKEKVFTKKEIKDALSEPLTAYRMEVPKLMPQFSYEMKKLGGDIIKSNIDLNTQFKTEKLVKDYVKALYSQNIRNAAVMIIDNRSHKVVSYVGSADYRDTVDYGQVNGVKAVREPGSTLKPLLYGLCVDAGLMTPKTIITDVAVNYNGYAPENYDKKFNGNVTMEFSLEHSLNIPAVKALRQLGTEKMIGTLTECNFKSIQKKQKGLGLSLILGGCGTNLEELTSLFAAFANDGVYCKPLLVQGDTIYDKVRILSEASDFMITDILSHVNRPDFPVSWQSTAHLPKIAWKTGTSYGRRDAWSIGYNKNYTVGVWVGNFSGQGIPELSGAGIATPLLFKIFNTIDYDSDEEWFAQPKSCETRIVCSETGMTRGEYCTHAVTDYFIPLVSSSMVCNDTREVLVSPDEKISYCHYCAPETGYKKKLFKIIAPDLQNYFKENGIAFEMIPLHNPNCEKIFKEGAPVITSPTNGTEYYLDTKDPEPIALTCETAIDVTKVYWYINNKFYKATDAKSKQFFIPEEGTVKISCTDDLGRNRDIRINVKKVDL